MKNWDAGDWAVAGVITAVATILAITMWLSIRIGNKQGACRARGFSDYDAYAGACYSRIYEAQR